MSMAVPSATVSTTSPLVTGEFSGTNKKRRRRSQAQILMAELETSSNSLTSCSDATATDDSTSVSASTSEESVNDHAGPSWADVARKHRPQLQISAQKRKSGTSVKVNKLKAEAKRRSSGRFRNVLKHPRIYDLTGSTGHVLSPETIYIGRPKPQPRRRTPARAKKTPRKSMTPKTPKSATKSPLAMAASPLVFSLPETPASPDAFISPWKSDSPSASVSLNTSDLSPEYGELKRMRKATPKVSELPASSPSSSGVKQLPRTPANQETPNLTNLKKLFKSPFVQATPNLDGLKHLLGAKSEREALVTGIRELMKTPKAQAEAILFGIRELVRTPQPDVEAIYIGIRKLVNVAAEDLKDVVGLDPGDLPRLFTVDVTKDKNEREVRYSGIQRLMRSPTKQKREELPDYADVMELFHEIFDEAEIQANLQVAENLEIADDLQPIIADDGNSLGTGIDSEADQPNNDDVGVSDVSEQTSQPSSPESMKSLATRAKLRLTAQKSVATVKTNTNVEDDLPPVRVQPSVLSFGVSVSASPSAEPVLTVDSSPSPPQRRRRAVATKSPFESTPVQAVGEEMLKAAIRSTRSNKNVQPTIVVSTEPSAEDDAAAARSEVGKPEPPVRRGRQPAKKAVVLEVPTTSLAATRTRRVSARSTRYSPMEGYQPSAQASSKRTVQIVAPTLRFDEEEQFVKPRHPVEPAPSPFAKKPPLRIPATTKSNKRARQVSESAPSSSESDDDDDVSNSPLQNKPSTASTTSAKPRGRAKGSAAKGSPKQRKVAAAKVKKTPTKAAQELTSDRGGKSLRPKRGQAQTVVPVTVSNDSSNQGTRCTRQTRRGVVESQQASVGKKASAGPGDADEDVVVVKPVIKQSSRRRAAKPMEDDESPSKVVDEPVAKPSRRRAAAKLLDDDESPEKPVIQSKLKATPRKDEVPAASPKTRQTRARRGITAVSSLAVTIEPTSRSTRSQRSAKVESVDQSNLKKSELPLPTSNSRTRRRAAERDPDSSDSEDMPSPPKAAKTVKQTARKKAVKEAVAAPSSAPTPTTTRRERRAALPIIRESPKKDSPEQKKPKAAAKPAKTEPKKEKTPEPPVTRSLRNARKISVESANVASPRTTRNGGRRK